MSNTSDDGFGMNDAPASAEMPGEATTQAEAQARDREIARAEYRAGPNPETHRIIEGRDHTFTIPRDRQGQPLDEFFQNAQLPPDLSKAVVYQTERGPVVAPPDPVKWNQTHDQKAVQYADRIKAQIDQVETDLQSYYRQLETLELQESMLAVKSPIAGEVVTWDAKRMMPIGRPFRS